VLIRRGTAARQSIHAEARKSIAMALTASLAVSPISQRTRRMVFRKYMSGIKAVTLNPISAEMREGCGTTN